MKISLICTDQDTWALGLRSISAALKSEGHKTSLIFLSSGEDQFTQTECEQLKGLVAESEIIGISSMSRSSEKAKRIIKALKSPDKVIAWGGVHPTIFPQDCVGHADIVCRGEGELFMIDLAERLGRHDDFADIPNGAHRKHGIPVMNDVGPLIKNPDTIPDYDFSFEDEFRLENGRFVKHGELSDEGGPIYFSGSRGCAYNCNYCSNGKIKSLYKKQGHFVRKMSIPKVVEGIAKIKEKMPKAKTVYLTEEDFFARSAEELKVFSELYPKQIGLQFECMGSPLQITEEKMQLLTDAGLWRLGIGAESGSDRTKREVYDRKMPNKAILKAASITKAFPSVISLYFLIIGNPFEEKNDLIETIRLLQQLPHPFFVRIYNLIFIPGTPLFERAVKEGIIKGKDDCGYEMDFLAGFDYTNHQWKLKNLYLNSIIYAMAGKTGKHRLGMVPRLLIPVLTHRRVVQWNDNFIFFAKLVILIKTKTMKLRSELASVLKRIFHDPIVVYRPSRRFQKKSSA